MFRDLSDTTRGFLLGIIALLCIVYVPFLGNALLSFDDNILITANPIVQRFTPLNVWFAFTTFDPELYIPLTILSFQLQHVFTGFSPVWLHGVNLLLHIGSTLLVFFITRRLTKRDAAALIAAALFALHPIQTEAVLWAAGRKDVLSTCLGLGSVVLWLRFAETHRQRDRRMSIVCFLLALLAKVSVAPLPWLLLLDARKREGKWTREQFVRLWPMFGLSIAFVVVALIGKTRNFQEGSFIDTILLAAKGAAFLLGKLVWPTGLSILYPQNLPVSQSLLEIGLSIVALVLIALIAFALRRRAPAVGMMFLASAILLLPNTTNVWKNGFVFFTTDRYAYLAAIPLFMLAGVGIDLLVRRRPSWRMPAFTIVTILVCVLAVRTSVQARTWKNDETVFRNALSAYPDTPIALNNLGVSLGPTDEALQLFRRAMAVVPQSGLPPRNIASLYYQRKDMVHAEGAYKLCVLLLNKKTHLTHDEASAYFEYAEFLDEQGRTAEALDQLREALRLAPELPEAHFNVGVKLQKTGAYDAALIELKAAADLAPNNAEFLYQLAAVYGEKGMLPDAAATLKRVVQLDPTNVKAAEHLRDIQSILTQGQ